jgi:hypothetical protein
MAFRFNTDLKNYLTETVVIAMAGTFGTAGTGSGRIYDYVYALNADAAAPTSGVGTMGDSYGWGTDSVGSIDGTASLALAITGTCGSDSTARWGMLYCISTGFTGSAATFRMEGSCGTAGTWDFVFDNIVLSNAGTISMGTCNIGVGP